MNPETAITCTCDEFNKVVFAVIYYTVDHVIVLRKSILCTVGRATGFQVTDEFIAQLPQQLIVSSRHIQLFENIGEGKSQISHTICTCVCHLYNTVHTTFPSLAIIRKTMEQWVKVRHAMML